MSKRFSREYLLRMRDDYLGEWDRKKRGRLLDEACRVTGLERKYVNKILLGHRGYRARKGRGKGHTPEAEPLLVQAIDQSLAREPFVPATLHKHDGMRDVQLRWRTGVVTWCDKPHSKEAKTAAARVLVVESRFDGKSIWLYAVCPDAMLDDPAGPERIALRAAQAYHDRWQIETSFQTVNALEKARVRTFKRLENLFALCILA